MALLAIAIPAHLLKHHDQIGALLAAVTLGLLLVHHKRFRVKSDMPTLRLGLARFALSLLFALAYGALGFVLMGERAFGREFSAADALYRTLRLFFSWGDSGLTPHTRYADWFLDSLSLVGVVTGGYAAFSLVRPVVWRRSTLPSERERARVLVEQYGRSSLDFFKYTPDKVYFFASNGHGVVSYGVALATAVALGDPVVATAQEFGGLVDEFVDFCDANGWRVAFHQVPPTNLACYRAAGLSAVKVGEEAIVDLDQFSLSGKAMKHLRATVNRFEREGYRTIWDEPPLSDDTLARLREVSDEWLTFAGRRERGFTLGQFDEDYLRDTPVMSVVGPNGHVVAFANVIPDGVPGEATIDLMRRRATPNGAMDVLYVRLFERMRGAGYRTFSLGMAPFAEVGDAPGASMPERAMHLFYEHFNGFFAYKGLRDYKDKFAPHWEPRYLVYDSDVSLPVVALALIRLTEAV
ncbi:MAG: phosphatidylglycerol lysyltransferase domain-containing protein [Gemmatimonadota bacterium]